jgi:DNA-binding beta-propeller fold protein YncE
VEVCCGGDCQTPTWTNQTTFGSFGDGPSQFSFPSGVAVSADMLTVWVTDTNNTRISVWTRPDASSTTWSNATTFGSFGSGASQFANPTGVAVAPDLLTVWVADSGNNRVSVWELACPA